MEFPGSVCPVVVVIHENQNFSCCCSFSFIVFSAYIWVCLEFLPLLSK